MKLTKDDVRKLAHLARLNLTDEELSSLANELTDILDYVDVLKEVNTEGVEETAQVTGLANVLREDEVKIELATPDELLECSPLPKAEHQIRIKRMM